MVHISAIRAALDCAIKRLTFVELGFEDADAMTPEERAIEFMRAIKFLPEDQETVVLVNIIQSIRNTALEEAAKVAETWPEWDDSAGHPWDTVAAAIRALKSPVSEGGE